MLCKGEEAREFLPETNCSDDFPTKEESSAVDEGEYPPDGYESRRVLRSFSHSSSLVSSSLGHLSQSIEASGQSLSMSLGEP